LLGSRLYSIKFESLIFKYPCEPHWGRQATSLTHKDYTRLKGYE
jgi:hypothetical protein